MLTEHSEVVCTTVPGVGRNLTWEVRVAGQSGNSLCVGGNCHVNVSTSYAPPVVAPSASGASAVTGAGVSGATTSGGQQLVIAGLQLGPAAGEAAPAVTYGPWGDVGRYEATGCAVAVDFSQITCLTAEGVGKGHFLAVTVGGQTSNAYEANITYSPPNVADYRTSWKAASGGSVGEGEGASTAGGQWVVLEGRNFGTVAENRIDMVTYSVAG